LSQHFSEHPLLLAKGSCGCIRFLLRCTNLADWACFKILWYSSLCLHANSTRHSLFSHCISIHETSSSAAITWLRGSGSVRTSKVHKRHHGQKCNRAGLWRKRHSDMRDKLLRGVRVALHEHVHCLLLKDSRLGREWIVYNRRQSGRRRRFRRLCGDNCRIVSCRPKLSVRGCVK
jgi:hypothetical protein